MIPFIADVRKQKIETEEDLDAIIANYYDEIVLMVSPEQKQTIAGFGGNYTRWMDVSDFPFFSRRDLLVYDKVNKAYIMKPNEVHEIGSTFELYLSRLIEEKIKTLPH